MAEKQKTDFKKQARVIDITQPGRSAPSASSRPVIVGHGPMIKDPMMHDSHDEPKEEKETITKAEPRVVVPLSAKVDQVEPKSENISDQKAVDEVPETVVAEPSDKPKGAIPSESETENQDKKSDEINANVENIDNQSDDLPVESDKDKKKDNDDKIQAEEAGRQAEVDKLIKEEKYFVRTSASKSKRRFRWVFVLIILLLLAGLYLALDSQIIKNDIKLPYEFFKEQIPVSTTSIGDFVNPEKINPTMQDSKDAQVTSQARSRDDERKADLKKLRESLETYYIDYAKYPQTLVEAGIKSEDTKDPNGNDYSYTITADGANYTLTAILENKQDPQADNNGNYVLKSVN